MWDSTLHTKITVICYVPPSVAFPDSIDDVGTLGRIYMLWCLQPDALCAMMTMIWVTRRCATYYSYSYDPDCTSIWADYTVPLTIYKRKYIPHYVSIRTIPGVRM